MQAIKQKHSEVIDPNILQRAASNPQESIWVGASAGTGKTKVLTDRVLRLLLPRNDGREGTPPNRILCLTFTKAAANEMSLRINKTLGHWAVMELEKLKSTLEDLLGHEPSVDQIEAAGQLFANVIDCPAGLQIMTIHSFCQSVLGRFPLEADLPPSFKLLDDSMASDMISSAQSDILKQAQSEQYSASPLSNALYSLASDLDEASFTSLINAICSERHQLLTLFNRYNNAHGVYAAICEYYEIKQGETADDIIAALCDQKCYDGVALRLVAQSLAQDKGKLAPVRAAKILQWLDSPLERRVEDFGIYKSAFVTQKGEMHKNAFPPKAMLKNNPEYADILHKEANRLIDASETLKRIKSAQMTRDLLIIGHEVLKRYNQIKHEHAALDFDDLILRTMTLLSGKTRCFSALSGDDISNIAPWIMYKLDQGLDHILVDEAQDTNPEQWRIIEALCEEFFSGNSARDEVLRTSFTVGDIKQSIYSFQRAAPEEFKHMQQRFDRKIKDSGKVNKNIALDISFRSTQSVLRVIDNIFKDEHLNKSIGGGNIHHKTFRTGQAGMVELWPLFEEAQKESHDFWQPPIAVQNQQSASSELASYIASNIRNWLDSKDMLPAYNRPVQAGDIMILVRTRSKFVDQLVRSLKSLDVPVSGADRMILGDQLAVQDLLALARFCLLPDDDLTLATALKSPILGWNEDEIFSLSYNRKGTLWQEICNFDYDKINEPVPHVSDQKREFARDYLSRLIGRARYLGTYEFFSHILNMKCPADNHSGLRAMRTRLGNDALDPIDEFLNAALAFSTDHTDHLQVFLDHQERKNVQIKREIKERGGQVQIMTIHGSKGLQAPIVIMPDTIKSSAARKMGRIIWPNKTGLCTPLYSPRQDDDPKAYKAIYDECSDQDDEEYYRLLYVAMTRAADRLYIAGYQGRKGAKESSWYFKIRAAMQSDDTCIELDNGHIRVENMQEAQPDKASDIALSIKDDSATLPEWALKAAPQEPTPPRPLIPSAPSIEEREAALSPLKAMNNKRFRRGNITHKLLQFLPDFAQDKRKNAALKFVHKNATDLSEKVRNDIVSEVMKIFANPKYAPFFSQQSMAEVSLTGLMTDNRIVSGQIDRLVIGENEIWIVDYKTNRPPPSDPKDIPLIYHKQLAAYHDSITEIYPNHKINCALLWTDGPSLMII